MATDIATIGLAVDTRQIKEGDKALADLGRTGTRTERDLNKATSQIETGFAGINKTIALVSAGLAALGASAFLSGVTSEQEQLQRNLLRTEQLLNATGRAAGLSTKALKEQAQTLAWNTLQSTEGVMEAQQILLTFRSVQGDTFTRGIALATDMASVLGGDLKGSITQVGKALENPIEGISALSRSGVSFTEGQKKVIKSLVETGDKAGAQRLILDELAREYEGVAQKEALGLAGAQDTLGQAIQEAKIAIADYIDAGVIASGVNAKFSTSIINTTNALKSGELDNTIDLLKITTAALLGAAAGYTAVTIAINAQAIALRAAAIAQSIFNATARANPYVLLASGIAAATFALYQYNSIVDKSAQNTIDMWKKAKTSSVEYANAQLRINETAKEVDDLLRKRLELEDKLAKVIRVRDSANFSQRARDFSAKQAESIQKEIDLLKDKQRAIVDARVEADKAENARIIADESKAKATQEEIKASQLLEVANAKREAAEKERAAKAQQLEDAYRSLRDSQREAIALFHDESEAAKIGYATQHGALKNLIQSKKDELLLDSQKLDALKSQQKTDDFMAQQAQELDALRQSYATKNEIVNQAYLQREAIIQRGVARGAILENEAAILRKQNEQQAADERVAIAKEEEDRKRQIELERLQNMSQLFGNLATLMQTENRKLFAIGKAAAIAQAIVNTATAITNALAVPPFPLGLALATTAGVAGAVQIATIQNQQMKGARAMGGDVQAGNSYLVGERGAEIITMGGNGHVTPNHKLGGDTKVTIVNQTTGKIDKVEERRMPDGELVLTILETVAAQTLDPNSKISRNQAAAFGLQRRR